MVLKTDEASTLPSMLWGYGWKLRFMEIGYSSTISVLVSYRLHWIGRFWKTSEVFLTTALGIVLDNCCVIRFWRDMIKRSATINTLFPPKIAVMLALDVYLVLGVTSSVTLSHVHLWDLALRRESKANQWHKRLISCTFKCIWCCFLLLLLSVKINQQVKGM